MTKKEAASYLKKISKMDLEEYAKARNGLKIEERERTAQDITLKAATLGLRAEVIAVDFVDIYNGGTVVQAGLTFDEAIGLLCRY